MAQLKQLSAGSSQIIMMMFRDKNNAPIKADSVHVKGSIFTGSGKPFEFEVNKGVCTNCKIQNDMLLFNIVPLLGLGQMQVNFWAAKVAPDGSLTEVPNSRYSTTIEANRKIAKNIQSKSISFPIQQGESVRFFG